MADFKRNVLTFSTGKQMKLHGTGFGINKAFEVGELFAPNILSLFEKPSYESNSFTVLNPHELTAEELHELADYNIAVWLALKDSIRRHGTATPKVFNREDIKINTGESSDELPKKKKMAGQPKEKDNGKGETAGSAKAEKWGTSTSQDTTSKNGNSSGGVGSDEVQGKLI